MPKKNRNELFFIKPNSIKFKRLKKNSKKNFFKKDYKSLSKFSLASGIVILIFFGLPVMTNFISENFRANIEVSNISKKNFDLTLNNKEIFKNENVDDETNLENVFDDIDVFNSDENNLNTSRLSASTIEQLFEDTKYNLKKVKETKLVNIGNSIDHLPKEMKKIENTKKRKNLFIQIVLPLIIEENTKIRLDRKKLFAILNKNNNSKTEKEWLSKKFKQYGVKSNDFSTLKIRMDEIPVSLAIAQAAKETGITSILIFNVEKSLLFTPYCLNFLDNHSFSVFELLFLFKIAKSFFLSKRIFVFSSIIKGSTICINKFFLFFVLSIFLISLGK